MKAVIASVMVATLACGQVVFGAEVAQPGNQAATASNQFGFDLYQQVRGSQEGNLLISPASISLALAMTGAGAQGQTWDEMAAVLHLDSQTPAEKLHADEGELLAALEYGGDPEEGRLAIANRIWVQQGYPLLPAFVRLTGEDYGAEVGEADFQTNPEAARQEINGWVEEQTEDKIEELFPAGTIGDLTRLVLVNTVYFRDDWATPFYEGATADAPFHVSADETVEAKLMHVEDGFAYADLDDFQMIVLPYNNLPAEIDFNFQEALEYDPSCSMVVLLPKEVDGLAALEEQLSSENLEEWSQELAHEQVKVYLPQFRTEAEFDLAETLTAMGMPSAFTAGEADFSGISSASELFIGIVRHKTFIAVDEKGTEAAAATGVAMLEGGLPQPAETEFRADHPFIYMIRNDDTGCVLFLGRVTNPVE